MRLWPRNHTQRQSISCYHADCVSFGKQCPIDAVVHRHPQIVKRFIFKVCVLFLLRLYLLLLFDPYLFFSSLFPLYFGIPTLCYSLFHPIVFSYILILTPSFFASLLSCVIRSVYSSHRLHSCVFPPEDC